MEDPHEKCAVRFSTIYGTMWAVKPTTNAEAWMKNDSKAVINLNITAGQLHHIKRATPSKHETSLRIYMSHAIR